MRIDGKWRTDDDGIPRPYVRGELRGADGGWNEVYLLVDTGADRSLFSYSAISPLGLEVSIASDRHLHGAGGLTPLGTIESSLRLIRLNAPPNLIHGPFAVSTDPAELAISLLGRDVLSHFATIVDRPGEVVTMLAGTHRYAIQEV